MKLLRFKTEEEFNKAAFDFVLNLNKENTLQNIALSGGSTPQKLYLKLAKTKLAKTSNFYILDERYVPRSHQHSNAKMISETLDPKYLYGFDTNLSIESSLKKYEKEIIDATFDLSILGMGNDGHTASIFPNTEAVESQKIVLSTQTEIFDVKERLTVGFSKIISSKNLLLLLKGSTKKQALNTLLESNKTALEFPTKKLLTHPHLTIFFADI